MSKYTTGTFLDDPYFDRFTDPYKRQGAKAIMEVLENLGFVRYDQINSAIIFELAIPGPNSHREYAISQRVSQEQFARLLEERLK